MRKSPLIYLGYCLAGVLTFLAGFYARELGLGQYGDKTAIIAQTKPAANTPDAKASGTKNNPLPKLEAGVISPDVAQLIQENAYLTANCNPGSAGNDDVGLPALKDSNKSVAELLTTLESLLAQDKTVEELQASAELQQLMMVMQSDPAAQKRVAERFLAVAGTPLAEVLAMALASSGGAEATVVAAQLLREGTRQERLSALSMLGQMGGLQDSATRTMVLDVLNNAAGTDVDLSLAALANLYRQGGVISATEQQDVVDSVLPLLHSHDSRLKEASLGVISEWANADDALKVFTEAANDPDESVRATAIANLSRSKFNFDGVRDTLLTKLQNPKEAIGVKNAARQALETYPLDEEALKIYKQNPVNNPMP